MRHRVSLFALTCVVWLMAPAWAQAERRVALVVGNGAYQHADALANPTLDADAFGEMLVKAGFSDVQVKRNLGAAAFRRALADFQLKAEGADTAIVYYSGHGLEFEGTNYLVPVDATLSRRVDVQDEAISLQRLQDVVAGASRLKLIILDACRTDPFTAIAGTRGINRGLARIEPDGANELIAYAARAGTVALDGPAGQHSPYTSALLHRLPTPGLDVDLALRLVRDDVLASTAQQQTPFHYGSLGGTQLPLVNKPDSETSTPKPAAGSSRPETTAPAVITDAHPLVGGAGKPPKADGKPDTVAILEAPSATAASTQADRWRRSAEDNDASAMDHLGNLYARMDDAGIRHATHDVPADDVTATNWYRRAAELGDTSGMFHYGIMLLTGRGTTRDPKVAADWFRRAAEEGHAAAMFNYGKMLSTGLGAPKNIGQAVDWFRRSADAGDPGGMNNFGLALATGLDGPKRVADGFSWIEKSARTGNLDAMNNLAAMYASGIGVPKSTSQAQFWRRTRADAIARLSAAK